MRSADPGWNQRTIPAVQREMEMRSGSRVGLKVVSAAVAVTLTLLAGCTADPTKATGTVDGPVLTVGPAREVAAMQAILDGRVGTDPGTGCLTLGPDGSTDPPPVVWPAGTVWQAAPAAVVLPGGRVIKVGDKVSAGGGGVAPDYVESLAGPSMRQALERCSNGDGTVALVQTF